MNAASSTFRTRLVETEIREPVPSSQMSRPLFHSDSEEEEDPLGQSSKPNFFGDSDDEDEEMQPEPEPISAPQKRAREEQDEDDVIEEIPPPSASWRARSPPKDVSSSSAAPSPDVIDEDDEIEESSPPHQARSSPPSKRRRISPPTSAPVNPTPSSPPKQHDSSSIIKSPYLGEMIIAEAWATTTGKSLLVVGDAVHIHKELRDEPAKNTSKDASKPTKGKQMKLTTMMKKAPPKPSKKQVEGAIVRFSNSKGQGPSTISLPGDLFPTLISIRNWSIT